MYKSNFNSFEAFVSGAYNLSNGLGGFIPGRKSNLYIYAGLGLAYTMGTEPENDNDFNNIVPGARVGFTYVHSLGKRISALVDLGVYAFSDNFNDIKFELPYDLRTNAKVGIRVNLDKKGAQKWVSEPEIRYVEKVVTQTDTVRIVERVVEEVVKESPLRVETVYFSINSSAISEPEASKVKSVADYLAENPEKAVIVIGTADRKTGNERINSKLRVNRAAAVSEMLVNKYGIDKSRVKLLTGKGDKEDLYQKQYEKNRAAICIITDLEHE